MVLQYVASFDTEEIVNRTLTYLLTQNMADSEESFLGLGILPNNQKTWFDIPNRPIKSPSFD